MSRHSQSTPVWAMASAERLLGMDRKAPTAGLPSFQSCFKRFIRMLLLSPWFLLLLDIRLDERGELHQRFLPAQIAHLGGDDVRDAFLGDVHVRAAGHGLQQDRDL